MGGEFSVQGPPDQASLWGCVLLPVCPHHTLSASQVAVPTAYLPSPLSFSDCVAVPAARSACLSVPVLLSFCFSHLLPVPVSLSIPRFHCLALCLSFLLGSLSVSLLFLFFLPVSLPLSLCLSLAHLKKIFFMYLLIYLAVPDLSCGTHMGSSSLTGSAES